MASSYPPNSAAYGFPNVFQSPLFFPSSGPSMFYRRQTPADSSQPNTANPNTSSQASFPSLGPNVPAEEWQLLLQMLFQQQQSLQVQMNQVCLALQQIQLTLGHVNNQLSAEKMHQPNVSRGPSDHVGPFGTMAQQDVHQNSHQNINLSQELRGAAATSNDGAPSTPVSTPPSVVPLDPPRRSPSKGNRSVDDANVSRPSSLIQPWNPKLSRPSSSLGSTPTGSRSGSLTNEAAPANPLVGRGAWQTAVPDVQAIGSRGKSAAVQPAVQRFSTANDPPAAQSEDLRRPRIIGREGTAKEMGENENGSNRNELHEVAAAGEGPSKNVAKPVTAAVPQRAQPVVHSSVARPPPPRGVHDISLDSDGYGSYESKAYMKSIGLLS